MRNERKPPSDDAPLSSPPSGPRSAPPGSGSPASPRPVSSASIPSNPVLTGWPVVETGLLMAQIGRVLIVHLNAETTPQSQRRHLDELARAIDARISPCGVLYDVPAARSLDAMGRKEAAEMLKAREEKLRRLTTAYALASPSVLARGILNAVFWIAPPPYIYSVVSTVTEGLNYIAAHTDGVSARLVEEEYRWLLERHAKVIEPNRPRSPPVTDKDKEQRSGPTSRRFF